MKKRTIFLVAILLVLTVPLFAQEPNPASDFKYKLNSTGNGVVITGYTGTRADVVIPAEIEGFPVMEIEGAIANTVGIQVYGLSGGAFRGSKITSVVFPNTKINIGRYAFNGSGLTSLTLPETINNVGDYAFTGCLELVSVTINMSINNPDWNPRNIFADCRKLITVTFTAPWVAIPREMFTGCISLTTVKFPSNLKHIRVRAFEDCPFSSALPEGIETIETGAFMTNDFRNRDGSYPSQLAREKEAALAALVIETLTIPEGVVSIGGDAFRNKKITKLILPSTIKTIDSGAFRYSGITELIIPENVVKINFGNPQTSFSDNKLNLQAQAVLRRLGYTGSF
jgi:hypothetical protein